MGLLDVLNGMQNGPRGAPTPGAQSGGGMSPLKMAMLALLAYKTFQHLRSGSSAATAASASGDGGGGLGDVLGGALGGNLGGGLGGGLGDVLKGVLTGGAAGSVISGGLGDLLNQFQQSGQSEAANSWVSRGPNKQISPNDLANALGADQINSLMSQSGLSREELLGGLSQHLPGVVDQLTPDGRLPTGDELESRL